MKGSIEQMALDIIMNKQKILEQEKELKFLYNTLMVWMFIMKWLN